MGTAYSKTKKVLKRKKHKSYKQMQAHLSSSARVCGDFETYQVESIEGGITVYDEAYDSPDVLYEDIEYENLHFPRQDRETVSSYDSAVCDISTIENSFAENLYSYNDDESSDHTHVSSVSLAASDSSGTQSSFSLGCHLLDSVNTVPFMVEAFEPLISKTVNVQEVIPYMPFLEDSGKIQNKHEINPQDAVVDLIRTVRASPELGKWQTFLDALDAAEYQYIVRILQCKTEKDHTTSRKLLKLFTPEIMTRMMPDDFMDHCFEAGVINQRDMEEVRRENDRRGPTAASLMLLDKIPRRSEMWPDVFMDVLKKCNMEDLIEQLQVPEHPVSQTEIPNGQTCEQTVIPREKKYTDERKKRKRRKKTSASDNAYLTPIYRLTDGHGTSNLSKLSHVRCNSSQTYRDQVHFESYSELQRLLKGAQLKQNNEIDLKNVIEKLLRQNADLKKELATRTIDSNTEHLLSLLSNASDKAMSLPQAECPNSVNDFFEKNKHCVQHPYTCTQSTNVYSVKTVSEGNIMSETIYAATDKAENDTLLYGEKDESLDVLHNYLPRIKQNNETALKLTANQNESYKKGVNEVGTATEVIGDSMIDDKRDHKKECVIESKNNSKSEIQDIKHKLANIENMLINIFKELPKHVISTQNVDESTYEIAEPIQIPIYSPPKISQYMPKSIIVPHFPQGLRSIDSGMFSDYISSSSMHYNI